MGATVSSEEYEWVYTEEPHATRRKEIIEKYPQVKKLFGHDPNLKWKASALVITQFIAAYYIRDASWGFLFLAAYFFGGTINHSLALAIHEIAHNLAFGHASPLKNRALGMWANLPFGIPYSISFKKYHLEHHRYQGDDQLDVDIPSRMEAKLFNRTLSKLIWVILQPFFYAIRPLFMRPKKVEKLEVVNFVVQAVVDCLVLYFMGHKSLVYLSAGTFLAMGLHPMAGHFISEHYMFIKGFETYSYYGPLNMLAFNVGYHNEHHDFPSVPGSRLPQVRKIAPEYYNDLPVCSSWVKVIWDFITDNEVGLYSRVKRPTRLSASGQIETKSLPNKQANGHLNDSKKKLN